jgi:hypothetical protein
VTGGDAIEEEKTEEKKETDAARASDGFEEFWSVYPQRDGDNPEAPARDAWRKAVAAGADPQAVISAARAYAAAKAGHERRYVASAARWLGEARWKDAGPKPVKAAPAPGVWIKAGSPEWRAWAEHYRETRRKSPPVDARGGWRFPAAFPPTAQPVAA